MESELSELQLLAMVRERQSKNSSKYYHPFEENQSKMLREMIESKLNMPVMGDNYCQLYFKNTNIVLSNGYKRVVIGDYGAYIEITPKQINLNTIKSRWAAKPKRKVKYIWMVPRDTKVRAKVYFQKGKVSYADYIPGLYYIAPEEITYVPDTDTQLIEDIDF